MNEDEDNKSYMDDKLYKMIQAKETSEILSSFTGDEMFVARTRGVENNNVFHVAARCGNGDFIKLALEQQSHDRIYDLLYEQNFKGEIPLHLAAQSGDKETVETLLAIHDSSSFGDHDDRKKLYLCMIDKQGDTPLHRALRYGHQDIAILLLQRDVDLGYLPENEAGESLAYLAAENLCERFLHTILDYEKYDQSSVSFSAPFGMTVFHAARNLNDDIMLALIERRKKFLKHQDNKGKTALHYAVEDAIEPMVDVLLKADSSLAFLHDNDGMTPLHRASRMGLFSIVRTILELSPQSISVICDKGEHVGQTPLHVAKMDASFLRVCLQHTSMKELINVVDNEGNTPLHIALKHKSSPQNVINALLEVGGINRRLKNNEGYTPMDLCKYDNNTNLVVSRESIIGINGEVVENSTPMKLSKSNGNIPSNLSELEFISWEDRFTSYRGVEGESLAHIAAREGRTEIINKVYQRCNISRVMVLSGENSKAETPLHVAAAAGKLQVVEAILKHSISTDKFGNKKAVQEEQLGVVIEASNADVVNDDESSNSEWKPWKMKSAKGDTPLHCALRNGHEQVAMRLIETDRSLIYSSVNKMNESPLYLASLTGCSTVVKLILSKSQSQDNRISSGGPDGQNALHAAIRRPRDLTTRQDLSNAPSFNFDKPKVSHHNQLTARYGLDTTTHYLIDFMPQLLNKADKDGKTPFHYVVELCKLDAPFIYLLAEKCKSATLYDNEGFTPLLRAAANGSFNCVSGLLYCRGLSSVVLRHADDESTMLHFLKVTSTDDIEKWVKIIERFPKIKKMINKTDKDGNTPLHCAILKSDSKKIRLLLSINGLRLTIYNKRHQTPMDLCTQLLAKGDSRHLAIWIALEDFVAKKEKRRSRVPLLLRMNTRVMMSYCDEGMTGDEDLKKLLENVAVAAALLITLTFAATFTIPGGYDQNTGQALRIKEASVKTFVASNVVAMLLGVGVLLTYTFGATKKAWLRVLSIPCVVMLQCALLATIVSFISGVYALVLQDAKWIATLAAAIVGGVLLLFSITPAAAGVVIQILKWLRKAGKVLLAILLILPYYVAKIFGQEYYLVDLIRRLSTSIRYWIP